MDRPGHRQVHANRSSRHRTRAAHGQHYAASRTFGQVFECALEFAVLAVQHAPVLTGTDGGMALNLLSGKLGLQFVDSLLLRHATSLPSTLDFGNPGTGRIFHRPVRSLLPPGLLFECLPCPLAGFGTLVPLVSEVLDKPSSQQRGSGRPMLDLEHVVYFAFEQDFGHVR